MVVYIFYSEATILQIYIVISAILRHLQRALDAKLSLLDE